MSCDHVVFECSSTRVLTHTCTHNRSTCFEKLCLAYYDALAFVLPEVSCICSALFHAEKIFNIQTFSLSFSLSLSLSLSISLRLSLCFVALINAVDADTTDAVCA